MLQKDLKQSSLDNSMPALAHMYKSAMRQIYGVDVYVMRRDYPRFAVFEDDLREEAIPIKEYAYTVGTILRKWCKFHKFKYIPVKVFTGDWALSRFMKVWQSETVTVGKPTNDDALLYSELLVGRMYVVTLLTRYVRLSSVVEDIKIMLSPEWYHMYTSKDKRRIKFVREAIVVLCEELGISNDGIETYNDVVSRKLS